MAKSFALDVSHDLKDLRRTLNRYQRKALPKATLQGLNRAAASVRGAAVKTLARETGIKQKAVRAGIALRKANRNRLAAVIEARGRPLNVIRFMTPAQIRTWVNSPKRPRPPVRAKPWGKKRVYRRRVFIGNDGRTLFIREGPSRKSIRGLHGPSIGRELVRKAVTRAIDKQFRERFPIELGRALNNELRKQGWR